MTKDDLIWVVIRGAGFVLLIRAVLVIPEILGSIAWIYYVGDGSASEGERLTLGSARSAAVSSVAYLAVYTTVGIYLLREGAWLHRLLSHVTPERSNTKPHTNAKLPPN